MLQYILQQTTKYYDKLEPTTIYYNVTQALKLKPPILSNPSSRSLAAPDGLDLGACTVVVMAVAGLCTLAICIHKTCALTLNPKPLTLSHGFVQQGLEPGVWESLSTRFSKMMRFPPRNSQRHVRPWACLPSCYIDI